MDQDQVATVETAVAGWRDDVRQPVLDALAVLAGQADEPAYDVAPAWPDHDLDRATEAARLLIQGGPETGQVGPDSLVALSPDAAGQLVADLAQAGRTDVLAWVVAAVPPHRLPVAALVRTAAGTPEGYERDALLRAAALASDLRLGRGLVEALADVPEPDRRALANAVAALAALRAELVDGSPYRWWHEPEAAMSEPPGEGGEPPPEQPEHDDEPVFRSGEPTTRKAYARLDVASGTDRADVVVVDQAFEVTVGLQPRRDAALVSSSALSFATGESVELEVVLLFDPTSITVTGSPRGRVTVTDLDPHPALTLTCVAAYGEDLAAERRLGVQLLRERQVVAVAWRTIVAVGSAVEVATAPPPPRRDVQLLDLDPLIGAEPPDLVVSVCRADTGSDSFVWTAYAADPAVTVPDLPSATTLDGDVAGFATETRRSIQFSADPAKDYLGLAGRAHRIGRAVPAGVQDALREIAAAPDRASPPTVLLLTEELVVPWELAALEPPLATTWGGDSPFLGAHVAASRWPLSEHRPRPRPRPSVEVRSGAVLTADYTGVPGWGRLDSAVAEAAEVTALFDPPATQVKPELWSVLDLFRGSPPGDVLHVALHGQYDAQGDQEGIVLLAASPTGGATAQFLTPAELENGSLDHGPFVFLNACQVGSDERVLGDYGGFASTLLRIGATGVVAPLWNVRDDVAAVVARSFYAATLPGPDPAGPDPVSAAEAVRALRATYTEAGVRSGTPGLHATLVAYQVFGHPRLRLTRDSTPTGPTPV